MDNIGIEGKRPECCWLIIKVAVVDKAVIWDTEIKKFLTNFFNPKKTFLIPSLKKVILKPKNIVASV